MTHLTTNYLIEPRSNVCGALVNVDTQIELLEHLEHLDHRDLAQDDQLKKKDQLRKLSAFHNADLAQFLDFEDGFAAILFDGVSTNQYGEPIGPRAASLVNDYFGTNGDNIRDTAALEEAIRELNGSLYQNRCSSTVIAAVVQGDSLTTYRVGDSSVYVFREEDGKGKNVFASMKGGIYLKDRRVFKNFLGTEQIIRPFPGEQEGSIPKETFVLQEEDYVVVASDGYYDGNVNNKEFIYRFISDILAEKQRPTAREIVVALEDSAMTADNNDDRSLWVVHHTGL